MSHKLNELISRALEANLVPFLEGSPGLGKSEAIRQVAKDFNLKFIDVRLSTLDPTDISGIPMRVEVLRADGSSVPRVQHVPSTLFPLEGDALPLKFKADGSPLMVEELDAKGNTIIDPLTNKPKLVQDYYDGWLVGFEELTSCMPAMQAAAFRILLEREVSEYKLHQDVFMVATGNKASDKGVVVPMSTPMRTRLCFIEVEPDNLQWLIWANKKGIDSRIISYIQWRPEMLHAFDPKIKQLNCPVPRTWEFADRLIKEDQSATADLESITVKLLSGVLGAATFEFNNFISIFGQLPSIADILKDPKNADMPTEAGHQYALATVIAEELANNRGNAADLVTYAERLELELQTVCFMDTFRKNRKLLREPALATWVSNNTDMINAGI